MYFTKKDAKKKHPFEYKQIYEILKVFKRFLAAKTHNYQQLLIS